LLPGRHWLIYELEGPFNSARTFTWPDSSLGHISSDHEAFAFAVTGSIRRSDTLNSAWKWYFHFLECKIKEAWAPLFHPILKNIDGYVYTPRDDDMAIGMQVLTAIVLNLQQSDLSLIEIVDGLYNRYLLKEVDVDRSTACQMVFAALGWISKQSEFPHKRTSLANVVQSYRPPVHAKNRSGRKTFGNQTIVTHEYTRL
jgi:hypothetical protein